ncbi:hypothetical protein LINPERPRIM_LOCUS9315 [Linum perenne]
MEGWEWGSASGELSDDEVYLEEDDDDNEELLTLVGPSKKLQFRSDVSKAIWDHEKGMAEVIEKKGKLWITMDLWLKLGHCISWTVEICSFPSKTCMRKLQKKRMAAAGSFSKNSKLPSRAEIEDLESRCGGIPVKVCHVDHGRVSFFSMKKVELPVLP